MIFIDNLCQKILLLDMQIKFSTRIEKKLKDDKAIKKYFPQEMAAVLHALSVLSAVETLNDVPNVPPTRRHKLQGDRNGYWAIDISRNRRMIIKPDGGIEPEDIRCVIITEITDYH